MCSTIFVMRLSISTNNVLLIFFHSTIPLIWRLWQNFKYLQTSVGPRSNINYLMNRNNFLKLMIQCNDMILIKIPIL